MERRITIISDIKLKIFTFHAPTPRESILQKEGTFGAQNTERTTQRRRKGNSQRNSFGKLAGTAMQKPHRDPVQTGAGVGRLQEGLQETKLNLEIEFCL